MVGRTVEWQLAVDSVEDVTPLLQDMFALIALTLNMFVIQFALTLIRGIWCTFAVLFALLFRKLFSSSIHPTLHCDGCENE